LVNECGVVMLRTTILDSLIRVGADDITTRVESNSFMQTAIDGIAG
jgi:hypothetical protein